ncbi:hypothetical protein LEN26_012942 [Aphanomyces euteiches]|nr:hypothetical protein LEN26_012942 [Aphanomyces euteiches]
MKTMKPSTLSFLPFDILVKIVFFLRQWHNVLALLEALRPANVLGPLESLWQLHLLNWKVCDLWPTLDLTGWNESSRDHLKKIAKFYSTVTVDVTTNAKVVCQHIHPNAAVHIKGQKFAKPDKKSIAKWKDFRVLASDDKIFTTPSCLVYFPHLVAISCQDCSTWMATTIFDYAALSSTLRILELKTEDNFFHKRCTITSQMAEQLIQWIESQPIESIAMRYFDWELYSQRHAMVSSALAKMSVSKLEIVDEYASGWGPSGHYYRAEKKLLQVCDPRYIGFENFDMLIEFIHSFEPVFDSEMKVLSLDFSGKFGDIWPLFGPVVQRLNLEQLTVTIFGITLAHVVKVVESVQNATKLRRLYVYDPKTEMLSIDMILALLHGVPPSVNQVPIVLFPSSLPRSYSQEECTMMQDVASKKGISLFYY